MMAEPWPLRGTPAISHVAPFPDPGAPSPHNANTQGLAVTRSGEVWVGALVDNAVRVYSLGHPAALEHLQQVRRRK